MGAFGPDGLNIPTPDKAKAPGIAGRFCFIYILPTDNTLSIRLINIKIRVYP